MKEYKDRYKSKIHEHKRYIDKLKGQIDNLQ